MVIECGYSYVPHNRGRIWYNLITKLEGFVCWDLFCKALIKECAQDFVCYFAPGARYVGVRCRRGRMVRSIRVRCVGTPYRKPNGRASDFCSMPNASRAKMSRWTNGCLGIVTN